MPRTTNTVPAAQLVDWINAQLDRLRDNETLHEPGTSHPAVKILAGRLGVAERTIFRYARSLDGENRPTDAYDRHPIEDALDRAGVPFWEVFPNLDGDVELADDAYCPKCHDTVTPIDGACPWCDTSVQRDDAPRRMYCPREDAMSYPALNGACWRCGGELERSVPWVPCACGCGTQIRRFDRYGREARYVTGHNPSPPRTGIVDAEPFAAWLEKELRELDPIQALARRIALSRRELLDLLNRRADTVGLEQVRRSLWLAAREGQGTGLPPRPGATHLADLYPDYVRSRICPGCGNGKAPHAELCKHCRRSAGGNGAQRKAVTSITEPLLVEARQAYEAGASFLEAAHVIHERTRCTNIESVANHLSTEFRRRGWIVRTPWETRRMKAAA